LEGNRYFIFIIVSLSVNLISVAMVDLPIVSGSSMTSTFANKGHVNYYVTAGGYSGGMRNGQLMTPDLEKCGDGQDNDGNGLVDENCPIESPSGDKPTVNFDTSKTLRVAVVGDVDANSGLTAQLDIANQYNVQALILTGDFEYSNGNKVLSDLESHGFTKENTDIVVGNHDSKKDVQAWLNENRTFGEVNFAFSGDRLALFNIDANTKFDCSSPQFEILKSQIESSNAWYKFAVVHQPFVTVKSVHPPNKEFGCYDPMFRAGGIDGVLQAHNHNYQRFDIDGLLYGVFGTGTHDNGSSMYPINSETWNGNNCIKCITGQNGITIIDLRIDNENSRQFNGWFINMGDEVLDHFENLNEATKVPINHFNQSGLLEPTQQ
jgi:predicted phosphodiesterase